MRLTYGMELEWADVDRHAVLPPELGSWNSKDYTIVNSDGHGNDPTGETWQWGGEINTVPTGTPEGQAAIVVALDEMLRPVVNYRCNTHVHVGVPGLADDLDGLKTMLRFILTWSEFVWEHVDPIPRPTRDEFVTAAEFEGAVKRWRRSKVSHHQRYPEAWAAAGLAAGTIDEFREGIRPMRSRHLAPRAGINLLPLWVHGTIEFRHFYGLRSGRAAESCCAWAGGFVTGALGGGPNPAELLASRPWSFPRKRPYDHDLELRYQATKVDAAKKAAKMRAEMKAKGIR